MQKYIWILLFVLSLNQNIYGTAQAPDFLIYKGDTLQIFTNPLESYFEKNPRPDNVFARYGYYSTGCWRGYIGYWELRNDSLFLLELQGDSISIDLNLIFKNRNVKNGIFADWFNSSVLNPYGKLVHYEHMGYGSIYEFEKELFFTNGIMTEIKHYDNSKSRKSKYTQDDKLLIKYLRRNIDHSLLPDSIKKAKVFVQILSVSENGEIDSVNVVRGFNVALDKEAIRVVKSIPDWDVIYWHGKPYNLIWALPITFERKYRKRPANKPQ